MNCWLVLSVSQFALEIVQKFLEKRNNIIVAHALRIFNNNHYWITYVYFFNIKKLNPSKFFVCLSVTYRMAFITLVIIFRARTSPHGYFYWPLFYLKIRINNFSLNKYTQENVTLQLYKIVVRNNLLLKRVCRIIKVKILLAYRVLCKSTWNNIGDNKQIKQRDRTYLLLNVSLNVQSLWFFFANGKNGLAHQCETKFIAYKVLF